MTQLADRLAPCNKQTLDPVALLVHQEEAATEQDRPLCSRLLVVDDARRLQPWGAGIQLRPRGRDGGLWHEPSTKWRPLLRGGTVNVAVSGSCVAVVVPGGWAKRRRERHVHGLTQLVAQAQPREVVLAAPLLWETEAFVTSLAPAVALYSDRVVAGRWTADLSTRLGLADWSLLVGVLGADSSAATVPATPEAA